jgi:hypothetical protein
MSICDAAVSEAANGTTALGMSGSQSLPVKQQHVIAELRMLNGLQSCQDAAYESCGALAVVPAVTLLFASKTWSCTWQNSADQLFTLICKTSIGCWHLLPCIGYRVCKPALAECRSSSLLCFTARKDEDDQS